MKLSIEWLNEFVSTDGINIKDYCHRMTMTGSKVEGYEELGADIDNVVVGKITSISKHENSDHLLVCMVDVGEGEPLQIVTGAQNVFEGALVPVAKSPSKLPGGVVIKAGKLRGVLSNGMLCSISELGLTINDVPYAIEDGILILQEECKPGDCIKKVLRLSDTVVEFEITPNRPDCLSVIGLARETAASFDREAKYHTPVVKESGDDVNSYISVEVDNSVLCPRYTARVVKNVKIAPSPLWMRRRLRASGVRPINNIVDITNYVMLEYGQPMHAFDYSCIDGKAIVVREAYEGEKFISLDSQSHKLSKGMLVIADKNKAIGLAGIMGGENSEIKDTTTTVVFESANFLGSSIRTTSRALGMRTESSARFEKGLDPENASKALERACELVELLGAGEVVKGVIDVYKNKPQTRTIKLDYKNINAFLGINIDKKEMEDILLSLHFEVANDIITVPSFRADVEGMQDIAEEIARIYGYDKIPASDFKTSVKTGKRTPEQKYRDEINNLLCEMGSYEIYSFSFMSRKNYDKIGLDVNSPERNSVVIKNPLGEDTSVMRTTLIPSLLEALARNNNYHSENTLLHEIARVYIPSEDETKLPTEKVQICFGGYGEGCDFYSVKGMCEAIFEASGIDEAEYKANAGYPTFHPGRCADVYVNGKIVGTLGEVHPKVCENYGFDNRVYVAVLDFETLFGSCDFKKSYKPLPKYPAVQRDFAFICDESMEVGVIEKAIKKAGGKIVENINLFDIYRGKQVGEGKKSVAFSVSMRAEDRTLTDTEADKAAQKIINYLEKEYSVTLRA